MKKRNKKITAAILSLCLLGSVWTVPALAEEAAASYDLSDNVIEFEEVGALVENYSVLAKQQDANFSSAVDAIGNVSTEYRNQMQELQDQIQDMIEDLQAAKDDATDADTKKSLQSEISALKKAKQGRSTSDNYAALSAGVKGLDKASDGYDDARKSLERTAEQTFYNYKKSMTNGMQGLLFSYKGLELTETLLKKQVEMYQLSYDKAVKQQALGSATAMDVTTAQINLVGAQNSLVQVQDGLDTMKRALGTNLGWTTETYGNITVGATPEYALDYIDNRELEVDIKSAMQQNYTYGQAQQMKQESYMVYNEKTITMESVEKQIRVEMQSLRDSVLQAREELNAAETSAEIARINKEKADRMYAVGLVSNADYDGLQLSYIVKENAVAQAKLNYHQAVFNYDQAVYKGVLTLS